LLFQNQKGLNFPTHRHKKKHKLDAKQSASVFDVQIWLQKFRAPGENAAFPPLNCLFAERERGRGKIVSPGNSKSVANEVGGGGGGG